MKDINKYKDAEELIMARQKKNQTTGTCRYCGQQMIIHLPEGWEPDEKTQEEYDALATEQCECEGAQSEAERARQKEEACARMVEYYSALMAPIDRNTPGGIEEIERLIRQQELMVRIIKMITDRHIAGASVQTTGAEAFSVSIKAKGKLCIRRVYKGMEEWIF